MYDAVEDLNNGGIFTISNMDVLDTLSKGLGDVVDTGSKNGRLLLKRGHKDVLTSNKICLYHVVCDIAVGALAGRYYHDSYQLARIYSITMPLRIKYVSTPIDVLNMYSVLTSDYWKIVDVSLDSPIKGSHIYADSKIAHLKGRRLHSAIMEIATKSMIERVHS
jgi:hypothetical protein